MVNKFLSSNTPTDNECCLSNTGGTLYITMRGTHLAQHPKEPPATRGPMTNQQSSKLDTQQPINMSCYNQ